MRTAAVMLAGLVFAGIQCAPPPSEEPATESTPSPVAQGVKENVAEGPPETAQTPSEEVGLASFVGAWYGYLGEPPESEHVRIDVAVENGTLRASLTVLADRRVEGGTVFELEQIELRDGVLRLQARFESDRRDKMLVELRLPRDELVCTLMPARGRHSFRFIVEKETSEWAARFAGAELHSPAEAQQRATRATCANNLKQIGLVLKLYAIENKGIWPALRDRPGCLMFRREDLYPEYVTDLRILVCPTVAEDPPEDIANMAQAAEYFDSRYYWYLGYALTDEAQGLAFVDAYRQQVAAGGRFEEDLDSDQPTGLRRLKEGVERYFITDISRQPENVPRQADIPVVIERPGHHKDGANVLFMDGHVAFCEYPGEWPMTEAFVRALESLDALRVE